MLLKWHEQGACGESMWKAECGVHQELLKDSDEQSEGHGLERWRWKYKQLMNIFSRNRVSEVDYFRICLEVEQENLLLGWLLKVKLQKEESTKYPQTFLFHFYFPYLTHHLLQESF